MATAACGASAAKSFATADGATPIAWRNAALAQLVVGRVLDRYGARPVFMTVAAIQAGVFALMPGLNDLAAVAVALGFMLGAFGQIPINDFMIGKMAVGEFRARAYAIRYLVNFTVLAATLPLISYAYGTWGFDTPLRLLAESTLVISLVVSLLPQQAVAVAQPA